MLWAANAALQPACIIQPRTTEDVSRIIKALANIDCLVAFRSGGHTQWKGSNDIHNGVSIDLGLMTAVSYDAETKLASIQPGPRWTDVYQELVKVGVCVTGGRDGSVGIGGFLTGGGNSYYADLMGLACDSVANFEVVLVNGDIVNANAKSNPELWKALKGGSGNFGIVTRFDMYTFPAKDLWSGIGAVARNFAEEVAQTMVDFTNDNFNNLGNAYIMLYHFGKVSSSEVTIAYAIINTDGVENASAFNDIRKIPTVFSDVKKRTIQDIVDSNVLPGGQQ